VDDGPWVAKWATHGRVEEGNPKGVLMNERMELTEVQLKRMELVILQYISKELAAEVGISPEVNCFLEGMAQDVVVRIKVAVLGREMEREEATYPANWWQAVKERWMPAWAKKRWPVKYRKIVLTAMELYPKVSLPGRKPVVVITKSDLPDFSADDDTLT
jgi:hypothetical protein